MISRYSRPIMQKVWEPENRFKIWFEIEAHAADAQAEIGVIPKSAAESLWKHGRFEIERIDQIEKKTHHDFIAFLTNLSEHVGPDARFIHQGMTSSDVIDTALSIQMSQASDIIINDIKDLLKSLKKRALEHKFSICIGRSHGIHAEPTTFGIKLAGFFSEFERNLKRLSTAKDDVSTCAISGPVGTYTNIDPRIEKYVAKKMDLSIEKLSTQIIPRDRHAAWFSSLAIVASSIERLAVEIRHLQRTEVREVEEYFSSGQKGSSAMPHKRNPILSENLTGLARVVRAAVLPALENVALWHERDISHSSVERVFAPDASIALDFALSRLTKVIEELLIYPEIMSKNLDKLKGLVNSQQVLLTLTQKGFSREEAYSIVQLEAMKVWDSDETFLELLKKNKRVTQKVSNEELIKIFDNENYLKQVNFIFNRVFNTQLS